MGNNGFDFNFNIKFVEKGKFIVCILYANNWKITSTQAIQKESDRISPIKRAKQKAFIRAMAEFNGRMCNQIKVYS